MGKKNKVKSYGVFYDNSPGADGPLEVNCDDVFPLPQDFGGWPAEAAGDNSESHVIGAEVRVQWTTDKGYYEWASGTVTGPDPDGGTSYNVKIDSDKFDFKNEKDKEDLWGRERIHPAPAPAALGPVGPAAAADGLAGLVAGLAGGAAGGDDDDAAILAKAKAQIKSPEQVQREFGDDAQLLQLSDEIDKITKARSAVVRCHPRV
jgi:hypothetical protein